MTYAYATVITLESPRRYRVSVGKGLIFGHGYALILPDIYHFVRSAIYNVFSRYKQRSMSNQILIL